MRSGAVEHDTGWFKSSRSTAGSNGCVEVRLTDTTAYIRDSKNPTGPQFTLTTRAWHSFLASASRR
ncbi:DUF397 domain-containing protein [Saccharothrix algeriensis]|uniref:DUF397 domain-containing protein n=1 Tax=Saccharothrix algeriensis TaxID=173560 RepID=A0A8T8HRP5_9PSEU|nr:DUF397 domain-containing protein [Saccharothrix algeriensis]QTR01071.1 DUF397 domain-containing protein [Saccharothrix algeriensis]